MLTSLSLSVFAESESASETEKDDSTIEVVVLINDVAPGKKIKSTDVEVKTFKNVNIPSNVISNINKVKGKYAKMQLYAGEYVYAEQLSGKSVATTNTQLLNQAISRSDKDFVNVTDYFPADTGEDVTALIQKIIDTNTKRTIYFPDGEYIISRPILTNGGAASTVSLWLSDGAVIKADPENWRTQSNDVTAMICLGKQDRDLASNNDVISAGSYYSIQGGTIDGSGVAETICLGGGRETLVKNIVLKNTPLGIDIKLGTNNVSSDMDIDDVTIIGNGKAKSIGINIDGYDNSFTNVRIYNCQTGVISSSGGNTFRDIRVYNTSSEINYADTVGMQEKTNSNNFYYHCYVQDCATAYILDGVSNTVDAVTAKWTKAQGNQTAFKINRWYHSCYSACRVEFFNSSTNNIVLNGSGNGRVEAPILNKGLSDSGDKYSSHLGGGSAVPLK